MFGREKSPMVAFLARTSKWALPFCAGKQNGGALARLPEFAGFQAEPALECGSRAAAFA
jgi:hypothetical protein